MTQISGPINLVRLEGEIDDIKKVYYLFMDYHMDPHEQTECTDVRSIHVRNYLINTIDALKGTNQMCDFFLEAFPDVSTYQTNFTNIYIRQLRSTFSRIFKFKFKENKVIKSDEFPNLRLHYVDVRSYFTFAVGDPFGIMNEIENFVYYHKCHLLYFDDLIKLQSTLDILNSQLKFIYDVCFEKSPKKVKHMPMIREFKGKFINYEGTEADNTIKYIINKIKNVYSHKNIKNEINEIFDKELTKLFDKYIELFNELQKFIEISKKMLSYKFNDKIYYDNKPTFFGLAQGNISNDIIQEIIKMYMDFSNTVVDIYVLFMDLYFLRRSLDKDYVTNSLVYTGAKHSANYITYLVNNFNFKVTNAYYSETKDMNKLNNIIKKMTDTEEVFDLFLPLTLHQCIDVSGFPKNFT